MERWQDVKAGEASIGKIQQRGSQWFARIPNRVDRGPFPSSEAAIAYLNEQQPPAPPATQAPADQTVSETTGDDKASRRGR